MDHPNVFDGCIWNGNKEETLKILKLMNEGVYQEIRSPLIQRTYFSNHTILICISRDKCLGYSSFDGNGWGGCTGPMSQLYIYFEKFLNEHLNNKIE